MVVTDFARSTKWHVAIFIVSVMMGYAESRAEDLYGLSSFDILFSSRLGLDKKERFALQEYRTEAALSLDLQDQWQLKARGGYVTERRLTGQPFSAVDIQDLYVRHEGQACTFNVGVQQVVWGKSDRLQVLDVIHSLDLRESYFGDWDRKRLPVAMLNAECGVGDQSLQLIVAPQTRFDRLPPTQGYFALPTVANQLAVANVPVTAGHAPHIGRIADWSGGLQWSGRAGDADITLNAYEGWQSQYRLVPDAGGQRYHQEPTRFRLLGASFARPFGPVVARLEVARTFGLTGYVQTGMLPTPVSFTQNSYLAGVDWVGNPWTFSAQYLQRSQMTGPDLLTPARQRTLTLGVRRDFLQDRLHVTMFSAWDRNHPASYVSMVASYEATADLLIKISIEKFNGSQNSFGVLASQSRLIAGFEYHLH